MICCISYFVYNFYIFWFCIWFVMWILLIITKSLSDELLVNKVVKLILQIWFCLFSVRLRVFKHSSRRLPWDNSPKSHWYSKPEGDTCILISRKLSTVNQIQSKMSKLNTNMYMKHDFLCLNGFSRGKHIIKISYKLPFTFWFF